MHQSDALPLELYASAGRRMQALVIDWALVAGSVTGLAFLAGLAIPVVSASAFALLFVIVLFYEPILVWEFGATLGHRLTNIRVVARSGEPPSLPQAFARYWIKSMLGIISFIPLLFADRRQALHDMITGTTVQVCDPDILRELGQSGTTDPSELEARDAATGLTRDQSNALSLLDAQMDQLRRSGLVSGQVLESYQRQRAAIVRGEVGAADFE